MGGCQSGKVLDLDVVNDSPAEVVIEVLGPDGADAGFREEINPGTVREFSVERPGPGGWTVTVDGEIATGWEEWPDDNPTIDLTIVIEPDGSVVVLDT